MKNKFINFGMFLFIMVLFFGSFSNKAFAANYYSENVTAYVAPSGSKTYHGTTPVIYSTVAVHPAVCGLKYSGTKFPKGTIIKTSTSLSFPDSISRTTFYVYDMGDVSCNRGLSANFFDIYFGVNTDANYDRALKFETKTVDYSTLN